MNRALQEIFRMGVEGSLVLLIVWLAGSLQGRWRCFGWRRVSGSFLLLVFS